MSKPVYDRHAHERMAAYDVSEADVERVLAKPSRRRASYGGRQEVYGTAANGRTLKVVVVEGSQPPIVVTVMPFSSRRLGRLMERGRDQ